MHVWASAKTSVIKRDAVTKKAQRTQEMLLLRSLIRLRIASF